MQSRRLGFFECQWGDKRGIVASAELSAYLKFAFSSMSGPNSESSLLASEVSAPVGWV